MRDGRVAVLLSPGYGGGWSTWNREIRDQMLFDPHIVDIMLRDEPRETRLQQAKILAELKYPGAYLDGMSTLEVQFVPEGTRFVIEEYDGFESITLEHDISWIIA